MRERRFTIGREKTCDIPIADESVSRVHAQISLLEGDQLFLTDCQSTNGTFVIRQGQKQPVRQEFVIPADQVQFGDVVLQVEDILAVIRQHQSIPSSEQLAHDAERHGRHGVSERGVRLVRCTCGAIKTKGKLCPGCGQ